MQGCGGGIVRKTRARWQVRHGVLAGAMAVAIVLGTGAPLYAEEAPTTDLFVVARDPNGDVRVVDGADAARAAVDVLIGRSDDEILSIEKDAPVHSLGTNDPLRGQQWTFDKTTFEAAWTTTRGAGVTVAVVDSGVRGDHEDLAAALVPGIDYVSPGGDGRTDPNGHGTHVAGIIAATVNNGRGGTGGAPDAHIMPIRVLDANGSGFVVRRRRGDHLRRRPRRPGDQPEPRWRATVAGHAAAMQYALSKGTIVLAAAGNGVGERQPADVPGGVSRRRSRSRPSMRTWLTRIVLELRQLRRHRGARRSSSCRRTARRPPATRACQRHVDGDAVRGGRGGAHRRPRTRAVDAAGVRSILLEQRYAISDRPGATTSSAHGLINPRARGVGRRSPFGSIKERKGTATGS